MVFNKTYFTNRKKTPPPSPDLLADLPRGVTGINGQLPAACWETGIPGNPGLHYNAANGDMLLGSLGGRLIGDGRDNRHLITFAGNRSGKSLTLIANQLHYPGNIVCVDVKPEIAAICALYRSQVLGHKVAILAPFYDPTAAPWLTPFVKSFNPYSILTKDLSKAVENAGLIADGNVIITQNGDPYWDISSRRFIKFGSLHVATHPGYEGRRNPITFKKLIAVGPDGKSGVKGFIKEMKTNMALDGAVAEAGMELEAKEEKELNYIVSSTHAHLEYLEFPSMRNCLVKNDFELSELKTSQGFDLFLCLTATRLSLANRLLRMILNLAFETLQSTRIREGGRLDETANGHPVLFMLDEFPALGYMSQLEVAAGQIAGFGVKLWPVLQDITQLKALYKDRWETFIGNAGTIQMFANTDVSTLEYLSKLLGTTGLLVENSSNPTFQQQTQGALGSSFQVQTSPLLTPAECALVFSRDDPLRRQCILRAGCKPVIIQRVRHFDKDAAEYVHFEGKYREFR